MNAQAEGLVRLLDGQGAHTPALDALDGLDEDRAAACPPGWPHSCHRILLHIVYWQELMLARLEERPAPFPRRADEGWPEPERNRWSDTVLRFARGLEAAKAHARTADLDDRIEGWRGIERREGISILAQHNSYHLGQIVILRRVLGAWPPPAGGDTW